MLGQDPLNSFGVREHQGSYTPPTPPQPTTTEALLHAMTKLTLERELHQSDTMQRNSSYGVNIPEINLKNYQLGCQKYNQLSSNQGFRYSTGQGGTRKKGVEMFYLCRSSFILGLSKIFGGPKS